MKFVIFRTESDDDHKFFRSAWIESSLKFSKCYKLSPETLLKLAEERKQFVHTNNGTIEILSHNKAQVGIVAYYFFKYGPDIICRIELVYLIENYRGRGLFMKLLNRALNASSRMQASCVEAYVDYSNQVSNVCFKKNKFYPLGLIYHKDL